MRADQGVIIDQAIGWHVRLAEARDDDWADFVAWLEIDPTHAAAYDEVALQDHAVAQARFPDPNDIPAAANDNPRKNWIWAAGGTAAAAALVAAIMPGLMASGTDPYTIATRDGQRRTIALADGTRIEISGGTRLLLDRANPRVATIERGEATFHVRHDAARPFAVMAGKTEIRDLGTVFNVMRQGADLSVAVAEGSVEYARGAQAGSLMAGDAISADALTGDFVRSKLSPALVGGWRSGRLSFSGQPLGAVSQTLRRLYGTDLALSPDLSERPFTGMVQFTGVAERDVPHLASLIGANWRRDRGRWILSETTAPAR